MCQYDQVAERERRGQEFGSSTVEGQAFDTLVRAPVSDLGNAVGALIGSDSRSCVGLLLRNLNPQTYLNNDSSDSSSSEQTPLEIEETPITSLDTKQGEGDPSLRKKRRNRNSLRIREDISDTANTDSLKTSGTTTILT